MLFSFIIFLSIVYLFFLFYKERIITNDRLDTIQEQLHNNYLQAPEEEQQLLDSIEMLITDVQTIKQLINKQDLAKQQKIIEERLIKTEKVLALLLKRYSLKIESDKVTVQLNNAYPVKKYYLNLPDSEGFFWNAFKKETPNKIDSFYYMESSTENPYKAHFCPNPNPEVLRRLLIDLDTMLLPVCILADNNKRGTQLVNIQPGTIEQLGEKWIVKEKAVVKII